MQKKVNDNYKTKSIAHSTKSSKYAIKESKTASKLKTTLVSVLLFFSILLFATLFIYMPQNEQESGVNQVAALSETGTCGTNVSYTWDSSSGTLTISGTGVMTDYTYSNSPFYNQTSIKKVIIESDVTSIGEYAFYNCSGLTSVKIGVGVTSIGKYAFYSCKNLTSETFESGSKLISIGNYAFFNCSCLTNITIPNGVTSIGECAFSSCSGLTSITIPDGVTSIGTNMFRNCSGLMSITIPDSVTSIGGSAFYGCSGLMSITIPDSVTSIGYSAFSSCSGLTIITVASKNENYDSRDNCNAIIETSTNTLILGCNNTKIPADVTSIGSYAFYGCSGLTSIIIPASVTSIGEYAFTNCGGLRSVTFESGSKLASIDRYVFQYCSGLTNIIIPDSVTKIDWYAFSNCSALTSIIIPNGVTSIGSYAFSGCSGLTSVTIGSDVTSIGDGAFGRCSSLTSITIPDSVTSINLEAFYGCTSLTNIIIPDSVENMYDVFSDCDNLTIIGSGDTTKTPYTYAKSHKINYATAWKITETTHTRTFWGFKDDSNATGVTQTESHNWENGVCSVCGEIHESTITLSVTTSVNRSFVVYILDSAGQPTRQFVVTNGTTISFQVKTTDSFTVQVYETLYSVIKIDGENRLKKTYSSLSGDTTIDISISGVTNINNWIMI